LYTKLKNEKTGHNMYNVRQKTGHVTYTLEKGSLSFNIRLY